MNRITLDETLRSTLGDLREEAEICDEKGKVVGYYFPLLEPQPSLYSWAETQITAEELERRAQQAGGRTTAEVLQRLKEQ